MQTIKVPIGKIQYSPTNPRKTFDDAKLRELGESIKHTGLINPPRVRSLGKDGYELIVGERRVRGAQMVGLLEIEVFVEDLSDEQVIEAQIVENAQRVDVHPIEEADAFLALQRDYGYTIDKLVEKTGKSASHLYGRIKLATALIKDAKKACLEGRITPSVAELIARLDSKLQPEALAIALGSLNGGEPPSFRAFQTIYHARFATRLEDAPFDTSDALLVESAGACGPCPHNSANAVELFPDLQKAAGVCTNTACFTTKCETTYQIKLVAAETRGIKVLDDKANEKLAKSKEGKGDYIDPSEAVPYDLLRPEQRSGSKRPTWEKLLGKKHEVPTVLAKDPRGAPLELLDRKKALEVLRENGKIDKPEKPASAKPAKASPEDDAKANAKAEKEHAKVIVRDGAFERALGDVAETIGELEAGSRKLLPVLRWFATKLMEYGDYEAQQVVARRRGITKSDAAEGIGRALDTAKTLPEILAIMIELEAAAMRQAVVEGAAWRKQDKAEFEGLLEMLGIDFDEHLEASQKAADAEKQSDDAKAAKKPAKKASK